MPFYEKHFEFRRLLNERKQNDLIPLLEDMLRDAYSETVANTMNEAQRIVNEDHLTIERRLENLRKEMM